MIRSGMSTGSWNGLDDGRIYSKSFLQLRCLWEGCMDVTGYVEAEDDDPEKSLNERILQFNDSEISNYY